MPLSVVRDSGYGRADVRASMHRVRPLAGFLRNNGPIVRQSYRLLRPNAVWHCDGYHKLIRYGVVIHGFIDGYCHTVSDPFADIRIFH
jgi:hypothetical protein